MATEQQSLIQAPFLEREHLSAQKQSPAVNPARPERREAHCIDCGRRITVGPDGTEYGHARGYRGDGRDELCPHHCYDGKLSAEGN